MTAPVSQNEFFALLDIARFGACAASSEGIIVFWNRRAEQIVGVAASQAIGRPYHDLIGSAENPSAQGQSQPSDYRSQQPGGGASVILATGSGDSLAVYLFDDDDTLASPSQSFGSTHQPPPDAMPSRAAPPDTSSSERLTPRETQILRLIATGFSTEQIASDLSISVHTVRNHVRGLRRKLNARTKLDAVVTALRRQLL